MSDGRFVSNASPLIALAQIGRLPLLHDLFGEITIPPVVRREIAPTIPNPPSWVIEYLLPFTVDPVVVRAALDLGERDALGLAIHLGARGVIVDDKRGRRLGTTLGFEVVGTLGVLLRAKRERLLTVVRPEIEALAGVGFYLSSSLRQLALEEAEEATNHDAGPDA
jgi:predicted nucleic acid-binding protein